MNSPESPADRNKLGPAIWRGFFIGVKDKNGMKVCALTLRINGKSQLRLFFLYVLFQMFVKINAIMKMDWGCAYLQVIGKADRHHTNKHQKI